jgi:hypothetical protein
MKILSLILFTIVLFTGCNAANQTPKHTLTNTEFNYYSIFDNKYDIIEFTPVGNSNYFCLMVNGSLTAGIKCYPKQINQSTKELK